MKKRIMGILIGLCLSTVIPAQAEDHPILRQIGTKLARGVVNVGTGWLEIPKQIYHVGREEGWLIGAIRGPIDGIGMCAARMVAGAYEIISFPIPVPSQYQPMLQPDYVWQPDRPEAHESHFEPSSTVDQ